MKGDWITSACSTYPTKLCCDTVPSSMNVDLRPDLDAGLDNPQNMACHNKVFETE